MTTLLHIETSTRTCSVCVAQDGVMVSLKEAAGDFDHARILTSLIDSVLADAGIDYGQLDAIAVSEGPGSYTGLRIGTATAKGLCYALDIPLIGIPTLQILACDLINGNKGFKKYAVLMPSRKDEVYVAIYSTKLETILPPTYMIVTELATVIPFEDCLIGISNSFEDSQIPNICKERPYNVVFHSSKNMVSLSYESHQFKTHKSLIYFEPLYLKGVYTAGRSQ